MSTHHHHPQHNPSRRPWISAIRPQLFPSLNSSTTRQKATYADAAQQLTSTSVTPKTPPPTTGKNAPPAATSSLRPTSRSRNILRFFAAKIRPTEPTPSLPSPPPTSPAPPDSHAAKEKREAALRERGLLPPIKPNKDLSRLEREQDRFLPIRPVEGAAIAVASPTGAETITAANLIKKEWEAKNRPEQERLKSFRFGAVSSLGHHEFETREDAGELLVSEPRLPAPDAPSSQQDDPDEGEALQDGTRRRSRDSAERDQGFGQPSPALPEPDHPETSLELVPPSSTNLDSPGLLPPESTHLPPSLDIETNLEPASPIPTTPIISLSPVAEEADPKGKDNATEGHQRKASVSESQISLATPSLDASSAVTSMLGTTESSPRIKTTTLTGAKNIPMIVESPIEEGPMPDGAVSNPAVEIQQDPLEEYRKNKARRKMRTMFGQDPSKRLTVSTSLTSMRRSVANTLLKTKSSITVKDQKRDNDTFGPSLLPPSRTYPLMEGRRSIPRRPISPTLYSRGSIIMETNAIEDEEVRRMTELAFLE